MNARPLVNDFSGGEISPRLEGRVDLALYHKSAKELTNWFPRAIGGGSKRAGTAYIANTLSNAAARLIPWTISSTLNFMVELTALHLRFYCNDALVTVSEGGAAVDITTVYLATELFEIKYAQSRNELVLVHPAHPPVYIRYISGSATAAVFDYTINDQSFAGNAAEWTAPTTDLPYTVDDLWEKIVLWCVPNKVYPATGTFAGKACTYVEHRDNYLILTLATGTFASIGTHTNTTLTGFSGLVVNSLAGVRVSGTDIPSGAYIVSNTATEAILSIAATGTHTITLTRGDLWIAKTTSYVHQGSLSVDLRPFIGTGNYPSCAFFFSGRLWMGGSDNDPETLWGSKIWDFRNFVLYETLEYTASEETDANTTNHTGETTLGGTTIASLTGTPAENSLVGKYVTSPNCAYGSQVLSNTTTSCVINLGAIAAGTAEVHFSDWKDYAITEYADVVRTTQQIAAANAVRIRLATEENERIVWIACKDNIYVGTSSSEWVIAGATDATRIEAQLVSRYGSYNIQARFVADAVVYVSASSRHVRQLSAQGTSLTAWADHMIKAGVTQMDFQQAPEVALWCVLKDGTVARCLFELEQGATAWMRFEVRSGDLVESVCVVPGADRDEVYFVVKRTVNSAVVRFIEKLKENTDATYATQWYLDAAAYKGASSFTTFSGLTHLASQSITLRHGTSLTDGVVETVIVSAGGVATLTTAATWCYAGLGYETRLRLPRIEFTETEGLKKAIGTVFFRLYRCANFTLRRSTDVSLPIVPVVLGTDCYSGPFPLTTDFPTGTDADLVIDSNDPVPLGIQTIVPEIAVGEA